MVLTEFGHLATADVACDLRAAIAGDAEAFGLLIELVRE